MKVLFKITSGLLLLLMVFSFVSGKAWCEEKEYQLSSDPRLEKAKEKFEKGQEFFEKGNREFRGRPGLAQKHFEYAEDYFNRAAFSYKELGEEHGIDTSREIAICEGLYRQAHVMVNKARKKRKRPGAGY